MFSYSGIVDLLIFYAQHSLVLIECVLCLFVSVRVRLYLGPYAYSLFFQQRSHVPKFGNWESEENVEYSAYFDEASKAKAKGGKMIDPSDPRDKPDRFSNYPAQVQASAFKTELEGKALKGLEIVKSKHEHRTNSEDSDLRRLTDQPHGRLRSYGSEPEALKDPEGLMSLIKKETLMSKQKQQFSQEEGAPRRSVDSALNHETIGGRRVTSDSPLHHQGGGVVGNGPLKALRHSAVSERSIENSPLHPHYQARVGGKGSGVSSPSWERKGSSQDSNQGSLTPGRSRLKPNTRGNETVNFCLSFFQLKNCKFSIVCVIFTRIA